MEPQFNTLVQSGTAYNPKLDVKLMVSGAGTDIIGNPALVKRAKRKTISQSMILCLIDIAKRKGDEKRVQEYWNTYHCLQKVVSANGKLYSNYCKNRFCTVCCAIRKAEIINKYYPVLKDWKDPHFVTLTVKSQPKSNLIKWFNGMDKAFELIHNRCKKRHQRGKGIKILGIKSLESNFNPIAKTYNPHFHILVPSKEIAELLKVEWLKQWTWEFTSPKGQKIRPVANLERDLVETIKYGSKIFTELDSKKKGKSSVPPTIYAAALDNIITAMKGRRIFDRFGFNLPKQKPKEPKFTFISNNQKWSFSLVESDWVNNVTGERLTNYTKPPELGFLLNNCINVELS